MALTPYENIVIGNFLYGLGLHLGTRVGAAAPLATIANIQQTPLDPILADVWFKLDGVCRLLEFKRVEANMDKDLIKRNALEDFLRTDEAMMRVSKKIHWFAQIHPHPQEGVELRLVPYLDFTVPSVVRINMTDYISSIGTAALSPPIDEPTAGEVQCYLRHLGELSSLGSASGGGLMVHVDADGKVQYIQLDDIRDLSLQRSLQHTRALAQTQKIEAAREITFERAIERHTPSHGISR